MSKGFPPSKFPATFSPGVSLRSERLEVDDLLARRVEARRVVHGRPDDARRARPLGYRRVALEHELPGAGNDDTEAWRRPVRLPLVDDPAPVRHLRRRCASTASQAPAPDLVDRHHGVDADPVLEPGRVGDLVHAVHVHRFVGRLERERLREWTKEHVVRPVPNDRRYVQLRRARDVLRVLGVRVRGGTGP